MTEAQRWRLAYEIAKTHADVLRLRLDVLTLRDEIRAQNDGGLELGPDRTGA